MRLWEQRAQEVGLKVVRPVDADRKVWGVLNENNWPDVARTLPQSGVTWDDAYDEVIALRAAIEVMGS